MYPNTAIIIVSYNAKYMMQENIYSIRQTLDKGSYHIYVVDNASTDGISEWLLEQEKNNNDISVILNDSNKGFPFACNQGVALADEIGDIDSDIFLLNNDTRLSINSVDNLKQALYSSDCIGAVGSISNYAGNNQSIDLDFALPEDYVRYGNSNNIVATEENKYDLWEERIRLSGFAILIKREVWNKAGGMDAAFSPGYYEDDDLSVKISLQGKRLLLCKNSFIYHAGSQSFNKVKDVSNILTKHYEMFINKYCFPISERAYIDKDQFEKLYFKRDKQFTFLEIDCGLGSNIKYIKSKYTNVNAFGIESIDSERNVSEKTENIYDSIDALYRDNPDISIDVLYAKEKTINELSDNEFAVLNKMCSENIIILPNASIDLKKIKLVIWDMDNTFWKGILSEGDVEIIPENIQLIKDLTDCGIINSISSKNNESEVLDKLKEIGLSDYFVFNNINWENKGQQITEKLSEMNLRSENTLFIDDDIRNLEEVDFCNEGIIASDPLIIPELVRFTQNIEKKDITHKRLNQYKTLELKRIAEKKCDSRTKFLFESEISIDIKFECKDEIDRIYDLVTRSNQLNYTKIRDSKEELDAILNDNHIEKAVISAKDKFGDYGIVGFYCFSNDGKIRHFLFSCRVIGMGIEQKIYMMLGCPEIEVVAPVAVELNKYESCEWISTNIPETKDKTNDENGIKILLKGPCDMAAIGSYLQGANITSEFNFVNENGIVVAGQNHSFHIVQSKKYDNLEINNIIKDIPFISMDDFNTSLFDSEYDVICLSLLPDCQAGLYENKENGFKIAFGSKNFDLTNIDNISGYIDGSIQNHGFKFSEDIISEFSKNWKFIGITPIEDIIDNLKFIISNVKGNSLILLYLGSELEYQGVNLEFERLASIHKIVNSKVKEFVKKYDNVFCIETSKYIHSQDDYLDCINHFKRNVYYDIATETVKYINEWTEVRNKIKEPFEYDTLIMTVPNDYKRLQHLHYVMHKYLPSRKIYFVGNSEVGELIENVEGVIRPSFIDEEDILSFKKVNDVLEDALKEILNGEKVPRGVTGWYYQQFLKMAYAYECKDEYYLVWDGDTVPCASFSMFNKETNSPYLDLKTEYHEEYFVTLSKILPGMGKVIKKSFISEHMLIKAEYMRELIECIESNDALKGNTFYEKILYCIPVDKLASNSFSEFETYGTFVALKHMNEYRLRDWYSFRYGGDFFDSKKISDSDFEWLAKDFFAISFEKNHEVREDHKNLFDNKEYQKKLSARQMLEIAQQEFKDGSFIESFD